MFDWRTISSQWASKSPHRIIDGDDPVRNLPALAVQWLDPTVSVEHGSARRLPVEEGGHRFSLK
jgi:hypothetical protein